MPLYGDEIRYGSGPVYGGDEVGLRFVLDVDWYGNGGFATTSEFEELIGFSVERGRKYFVKADGKGFAEAEVGKLDAKLSNRSGKYDPYNLSSPLYPYVQPKKLFRLRAVYGLDIYYLITGRTTNIQPIGGVSPEARITGSDGWESLKTKVTLGLQENKDSDVLFNALLDAVGWQWGRDIGLGASTLTYFWCDNEPVKSAVHSLAAAELGQMSIGNDGTFIYRSRHVVPDTMATIRGEDVDKNAGYATPQPWEVVRNRVMLNAHPQQMQSESILWELGEKTFVPSGGTKEIWIDYSYNNQPVPAKNVLSTPAKPTDFTANTLADGTGTDLTNLWTVTVTPFSKRAKVSWKNLSSFGGYITKTRVRGQAIISPYSQSVLSENTDSQALYEVLDFELDSPWLQDINAAEDFANYLVSVLSYPKPYFDCWLLPNELLQLNIGVNKRYQLNIPELGLLGMYNVAWFGHYWDIASDGLTFRTRVLFEPATDSGSVTAMSFPYQFEVNSDFAL